LDFRYSRWDERFAQNLDFLKNLLSLYHRLLLMTDGNVDQALRAQELGERFGFFQKFNRGFQEAPARRDAGSGSERKAS
jgi:hypothetical protein